MEGRFGVEEDQSRAGEGRSGAGGWSEIRELREYTREDRWTTALDEGAEIPTPPLAPNSLPTSPTPVSPVHHKGLMDETQVWSRFGRCTFELR